MTAEPHAAVGLNGRYGLVRGDLLVGRDSRQWVVTDFDELGRAVAEAEVMPQLGRRRSRRPPGTIVAFVLIVGAISVSALVDAGLDRRLVGAAGLLYIAAVAALWFGVSISWLALTMLTALMVIAALAAPYPSWAFAGNALLVALLVAPPTRRYVSWPRRLRRFIADR